MTDDHRVEPRHRTLKGGRIAINDGFSTFQCMIKNLSETGARLKLASVVGIPDSFQLVMDDGRKFDCAVAWRTADEIGVKFTQH
ncbi:PilZ domain-containing protein [Devosia sp. 2618]|uniref:PilZ domain-containing protein n=1 Tax=Devosia sp. 2618 TaxID=3156454 RepID=UPI0033985975